MKFASNTSFNDYQSGVSRIEKDNKIGFVNRKGNEVVSAKYDNVYDISEGLAATQRNGKWGYIDKTGKPVASNARESFASSFVQEEDKIKVRAEK